MGRYPHSSGWVGLRSSLLSYQKSNQRPAHKTLSAPATSSLHGGVLGCQGNKGSTLPPHLDATQAKAGQGFHGGGPGAQLSGSVWVGLGE